MSRVVVVGAGLAALRVCERLRGLGYDSELLVIGAETHRPYNRPPLTKEFLAGRSTIEKLSFPQREATADVQWSLGSTVTDIDVDAQQVTSTDPDGQLRTTSYDGLVYATGVRARRLDLDLAAERRHAIRTIEDAQRLATALTTGTQVAVIGGGFVGSEVAATAVTLGCAVTVVEPRTTPLEIPLGARIGAELQRRHEEHGVKFQLGRSVRSTDGRLFLTDDNRLDARPIDAEPLDADVVVESIGSIANVEPLAGQGFDLSNGVLCDDWLRPVRDGVAVENIVVTGDVARFPIAGFGSAPMRYEHWTMPTDMATRAAESLLCGMHGTQRPSAPLTVLPTFWSDIYRVRLQCFGVPHLGLGDIRLLAGDLSTETAIGYHCDGQLVAVVLLGMGKEMLEYRSAVVSAQQARVAAHVG